MVGDLLQCYVVLVCSSLGPIYTTVSLSRFRCGEYEESNQPALNKSYCFLPNILPTERLWLLSGTQCPYIRCEQPGFGKIAETATLAGWVAGGVDCFRPPLALLRALFQPMRIESLRSAAPPKIGVIRNSCRAFCDVLFYLPKDRACTIR
jgi:hypothetical protein